MHHYTKLIKGLIIALAILTSPLLQAQEGRDFVFDTEVETQEEEKILEVDASLFRMLVTHARDNYKSATQYYWAPVSTRRRGLYYTISRELVEPAKEYVTTLVEPYSQSKVSIYSSQANYRVGTSLSHSQMLSNGYSLTSSLWLQSGRDMFVEGVFRSTISPKVTINKRFGKDHFLALNAQLYYSMRGLQYGTTAEAFELVGSNYYNPSWGLYNGEVRNSRVRRDLSPEILLHYQRPIDLQNQLVVEGEARYSSRANSSLGWYNATTPMPDYYRKMPSFMAEGDVKDYVTDLWRNADKSYTQINWGEIARLNSLSRDGSAFYVQEDRVEESFDSRLSVVVQNTLSTSLKFTYGIELETTSEESFKRLRDLLGAEYLADYDVFMGDSYNKTTPLQNNLLELDHKVLEGDKFGYNYTVNRTKLQALFRVNYQARRLDFNLETTIGSEYDYRIGNYQKERFATTSLGESTIVENTPYTLRAVVGYAYEANKYFALKLLSARLSPQANNLFLNPTAANFLSPSLSGEQISSAGLAFRFNYPWVSLSAEIYALKSQDGSSLYSAYDDLTATMCRAAITDIGYSSYGVEAVADFRLHHDLKLTSTLSAGRYYYDTNPNVELFDDYSLQSICSPTESNMRGVEIGNAPQIVATTSLTYFTQSNYIVSLTTSYLAQRYEQPSMLRRSERLLTQAFVTAESAESAMEQIRLDDIFDVELSLSRSFWFDNGGRLYARISVSNLLGQSNRITYAKESDRVLLQSVDGYFSGATMREGMRVYAAPRNIRLSVSYTF